MSDCTCTCHSIKRAKCVWCAGKHPDSVSDWESEPGPVKVDQSPNGCWTACIATITGIPLAELNQDIPADATDEWFEDNETRLYNDMIKRLRERGWRLENVGKDIPRGYSIASGKSPRRPSIWHAVVAKDGEVWHDPHPSRDGLWGEVQCYEVLIPLVGSGYL